MASLAAVRAKIDRAEKHFEEFQAAFRADGTIAATRVEVTNIENQREGKHVTGSITASDPPPDLGIPIGDAVHNLRSALDHLICQLAIVNGRASACDRTQFPIFAQNTPDNLKRIERWVKDVSPTAQTAIKSLQPYQRRPHDPWSDLLWLLSELDNIDKHRLLLVANPKLAELRLRVFIDGESKSYPISKSPEWSPLKLGTVPFRITVPYDIIKPQSEMTVQADTMIGVVFDQTGLKCDGVEIARIIPEMIADVKAVVSLFEAQFF